MFIRYVSIRDVYQKMRLQIFNRMKNTIPMETILQTTRFRYQSKSSLLIRNISLFDEKLYQAIVKKDSANKKR